MDVTAPDLPSEPARSGRLPKAYDAFVSYSHRADGLFGPALQRGLQRLAKPWNQRRAMEVFRDQTGLAAGPALWPGIQAALDAARWFVLLVLAVTASVLAAVRTVTVVRQRDAAISQVAAISSARLPDTSLAAQLSLAAYRISPTVEARSALLSSLARPVGTRLLGHGDQVNAVAVAPDGRVAASASRDGTVLLWDLADPARPRPPAVLTGHTDLVAAAAFSPDGRFLATTSADHTVKVWDLTAESPALHATLTGHPDWTLGVAFRPDGGVLATGSRDGTVRLWSVDPGWTAWRLCEQVGAATTREEWAQYLPAVPYDPPCP
ncbi:WD40 repeat domain-containing protein [Streptosporangium sp. CA-135522]|uniref:WD40 repeat domain-containing protein n=1 Tax=Streptosporangium sp. CA-135522 TaxID=3240072 RepID=UPI003D937DC6